MAAKERAERSVSLNEAVSEAEHACVEYGAVGRISDAMPAAVDGEVRRIVDDCYAEARRLLRANRDKLDAIVKQLLIHETLDGPDVYAAAGIERPSTTGPTVAQ